MEEIMTVYKYYYYGEIPEFLESFGKEHDIDQLVDVNNEFKLNSSDRVYLYAVTNKKKKAKMFTELRDMKKFISVKTEMNLEDYDNFIKDTDGLYELKVQSYSINGSKSIISNKSILATGFELLYISDPNFLVRHYLEYSNGMPMMNFLANSKSVDGYFRKSINTFGMLFMVEELKNDYSGNENLPFTVYAANAYKLYYYLFGFTY